MELLVKALIGYLCGSVVGSLLLGRLRGVDIRGLGSGNPGGTNALRTQGPVFALGVVLVDVLKAVLPMLWLTPASLPGVPVNPDMDRELVAVAIGAGAVVGHVYPLWFGFRGGKGMATLLGAYAVLDPLMLAVVVGTWVAVVALTGYVGLGTMIAAAAAPVWLAATGRVPGVLFTFTVIMAVFILYTHRSNIARMRAGVESRLWRGLLGGGSG